MNRRIKLMLSVMSAGWWLGCALEPAEGQTGITITAFESSGQLTFSATPGTKCGIEWASSLTSEWSRTWDQLSSFTTTAATTTVKVPMFYRVVSLQAFLTLPFEGLSDMGPITQAYSETASCPWGCIHNGIDFSPSVNLKPFVSAASGTVTSILLFQDGANWVVDVGLLHNTEKLSGYSFEPMSSSMLDGSNQLANIVVTGSQTVAQGEIIGYLCAPSNGAHVHYQFMTNGVAANPKPFFSNAAVTSILYLVNLQWPGADMSY